MARRSEGTKRKDCHERALGLLAVRQRSRRELERRLLGAGFEATEVADTLERLERVGLIDDEAFARAVAEHGIEHRSESGRMIARRLATAGVAPETAAAVIADLGDDEQERADQLASTRVARLASLEPAKAYQRLCSFLVRRGYGFEVARLAATRALRVDTTEG